MEFVDSCLAPVLGSWSMLSCHYSIRFYWNSKRGLGSITLSNPDVLIDSTIMLSNPDVLIDSTIMLSTIDIA
jgi:hypothetical protein